MKYLASRLFYVVIIQLLVITQIVSQVQINLYNTNMVRNGTICRNNYFYVSASGGSASKFYWYYYTPEYDPATGKYGYPYDEESFSTNPGQTKRLRANFSRKTYYATTWDGSSNWVYIVGSITVTPFLPATPTASTSGSVCQQGTVTLTANCSTSGVSYNWYLGSTLKKAGETGQRTYSPHVSNTTTYTVKAVKNGCYSGGRNVTATALKPQLENEQGATTCGPQAVTLKAYGKGDATVRWYLQNGGGYSYKATGTSYTTPTITSTLKYKAEAWINSCPGESRLVEATFVPKPSLEVVRDGSRCGPGVVKLVGEASPNAVTEWYPEDEYLEYTSANGKYYPTIYQSTYYTIRAVSNVNNQCKSPYSTVYATINPNPSNPVLLSDPSPSFLNTGDVTIKVSDPGSGMDIWWYKGATKINGVYATEPVQTFSVSENTTYTAKKHNTSTGCLSTGINIPVTIYELTFDDLTNEPYKTVYVEGENVPQYLVNSSSGSVTFHLSGSHAWTSNITGGTWLSHNISGGTESDITYNFTGNLSSQYRKATIEYQIEDQAKKIQILQQGMRADPTDTENYIQTTTYWDAGTSLQNVADVRQNIVYYDGLGRPMQNISVGTSPTNRDVVTHIEYDPYGRQDKNFLPYSSVGATPNLGAYKTLSASEQTWVYHTEMGFGTDGQYAYSQKEYDNSPLNRVVSEAAPGEDWAGPGGHRVHYTYDGNSETIPILTFDNTAEPSEYYFGTLTVTSSSYVANSLYKKVTVDENDNGTVVEYTDKQGRVILKRTLLEKGPDLWAETRYVYDDFGLLRMVLPPVAYEGVKSWGAGNYPVDKTTSANTIKLWNECYVYHYDERRRMTAKKLPGVQPVYMVYDGRDRLVATQDGELRNDGLWIFTKYDKFNRPIMTGKMTYSGSRDALQTTVNTFITDQSKYYEDIGSTLMGYTKRAFPTTGISEENLLSVTYYDNYDVPFLSNADYDFDKGATIISYTDENGLPTYNKNVRGQVTASCTKVLDGTGYWIYTVTYYDDKYRPVQTISNNYLGGIDQVSTKYNFIGEVLETEQYHQVPGMPVRIVAERFEYDAAGRLINHYYKLDTKDEILMASNTYYETGQPEQKRMHRKAGTSYFEQELDYKYNIRGWLTGINDPANLGGDLFAMELLYNDTSALPNMTTIPQYNGNIAAMIWKNSRVSNQKAYCYNYDSGNRIKAANYGEGITSISDAGRYDVSGIGYDLNGNIKTLNRYGTSGYIDRLAYNYNGNQLIGMNDASRSAVGYNDEIPGDGSVGNESNEATHEFLYDENGNLTNDRNKNVEMLIDYNYLNLPEKIEQYETSSGYKKYENIYDAAGIKHVSTYDWDDEGIIDRYYIGPFVYSQQLGVSGTRDFELEYIITPGGRITFTSSTPVYEYHLKDHLGNTRVTFKPSETEPIVLQVSDYYPFGMRHEPVVPDNDNKYLYNGKELYDNMDLDWYDYGFRFYDPALGRFPSLDPLADKFHWVSPYNYAENSPISNIDWWGLQKVFFMKGLQENKGYMRAYNAQRKTTLGKEFRNKLKNQTKYNVLYTTYSYWDDYSEGRMGAYENFDKFKNSNSGFIKKLNKDGVKKCFDDNKQLIVIGISNQNQDETDTDKVKDAAKTLNHEEGAHGIDLVEDGEDDTTGNEEHDIYHNTNTNSSLSPSEEEIQTDAKYKGSPAQINYDQIDKILDEQDEK